MFAFSTNEPLTNWRTKPQGGAFGAAVSLGQDLTAGRSITSFIGDELSSFADMLTPVDERKTDPVMAPDELRAQYPGIEFDRYMRKSEAQEIAERHKARTIQQARIAAAEPGAMGALGVFAGTMLGSMLHPVDAAASILIPETAFIRPLRAARAAIGLKAIGIGEKYIASSIAGAAGNAAIEPFVALREKRDLFPYTAGDFALNVAAGAVASPILRGLGELAGKALGRAGEITRNLPDGENMAIAREMVNQVLEGLERPDVSRHVELADLKARAMGAAEAGRKTEEQIRAEAETIVRAEFEAKKQPVDEAEVKRIVEERVGARVESVKPIYDEATFRESLSEIRSQLNVVGEAGKPPNTVDAVKAITERYGKDATQRAFTGYQGARFGVDTAKQGQAVKATSFALFAKEVIRGHPIAERAMMDASIAARAPVEPAVRSELEAAAARRAEADYSARMEQEVARLKSQQDVDVEARYRQELAKEIEQAKAQGMVVSDDFAAKLTDEDPELAAKLFAEEIAEMKAKAATLEGDAADLLKAVMPEGAQKAVDEIVALSKAGESGKSKLSEAVRKVYPCIIKNA